MEVMKLIKAILNGLLTVLTGVVSFLLTPINALVDNLFPDMANAIATFNSFVDTYLGSNLAYFFSMFPPIFKSLLVLFFTFCIAYYTVHFTYIALVKIFTIIQKVKFW